MARSRWIYLWLLVFVVFQGCNVQESVRTQSTQKLTKDLMDDSVILEIQYAFSRPEFNIYIKTKEEPTDGQITSMLEKVKRFSTPENVQKVAESVNWKGKISRINLILYMDSKSKWVVKYTASYFKTFDTSNLAKENIDGYRTWTKYLESTK